MITETTKTKQAYGVNIYHADEDMWERFVTKQTYEEALVVYNVLKDETIELHCVNRLWDGVEIERIEEAQNGRDWIYETIVQSYNNKVMSNEIFWEGMRKTNKCIESFSINEDTNPSTGATINICWLKLGWVSPSSNCGFFHYESLEEFITNLRACKPLSSCSKSIQEEYLSWLECNKHLLDPYTESFNVIADLLVHSDVYNVLDRWKKS